MKIVLRQRNNNEWDYRFVSDNGNVLLVSEGYDNKGNAKRAVKNFLDSIQDYILKDNEFHYVESIENDKLKTTLVNEGL